MHPRQDYCYSHGLLLTTNGALTNTVNVPPLNIVFTPNHALLVPHQKQRELVGDTRSYKDNVARILKSDLSIEQLKVFKGALGGDNAGFTIPTSTDALRALIPKLRGLVKTARACSKFISQRQVAIYRKREGGAIYVNAGQPGNNFEDQAPMGESGIINFDLAAPAPYNSALIPANAFAPNVPPAAIGPNPAWGQFATKVLKRKS